jgi:hypothetical protein
MKTYSLGRGRKKAVERFTTRDGLWMTGWIAAVMTGLMVLWALGYLLVDMH